MATLTLYATEDIGYDGSAHVAGSAGISQLLVGWPFFGSRRDMLVKFDLSSLPAGAIIDSAVLRFTIGTNGIASGRTGCQVDLHAVHTAWSEAGAASLTYGGVLASKGEPWTSGTWEPSITAQVASWAAGATNHGLALKASAQHGDWDGNGAAQIYASEIADTSLEPRLVITYHTNVAPNAPSLVTPVGATSIDRTATNTFDWTFSDPDAGDSQSAYDLRYRLVGAGSWTTLSATTTATFRDIAGGTFAAGDYEWQVRTADALGLVGPYSASGFFAAASPPATPTITAPTNGSTISTAADTVTWSTPSQASYQVRKVADAAGSPNTAVVYYDSGEVVSAPARAASLIFPTNSRWEHIQVRIKVAGLWSAWASVRVQVSYTPPATPTAVVSANTPTGAITVTATHPAPAGTQPAVTAMRVHRRIVGDAGDGSHMKVVSAGALVETVPPSGSGVDYAVASGAAYEYRVEDLGDNGTTAFSAWAS